MKSKSVRAAYGRLPLVAIVGRPNVGKSTLFNRLVGKRKAIMHETAGLTRDRNFEKTHWAGREYLAVDTGGYDPDDRDFMRTAIVEQTRMAIDEADSIVFVVDVRDGLTSLDMEAVDLLRRTAKPVMLAVNKCDKTSEYQEAFSFSAMGFDPVFPVSALKGYGVGELLDAVIASLPDAPEEETDETLLNAPKIAIVGRQNAGKSTLVNMLLGEKRMIASPEPGTTRDAIDSLVWHDEKAYVLIDTAGIRRRGKIGQGIEKLSVMRASAAMERADVAIILVDAVEGITEQDAHIAGFAVEAGCAAIIVVNKWDTVEKDTSTAGMWARNLRAELQFLSYAPIVMISALKGQRVTKLYKLIDDAVAQHRRRIDRPEFKAWLDSALNKTPPPTRKGRQLSVKYGFQVANKPPTFALFVNDPDLMHFSYERHLMNSLRERFGFEGTPIRINLRKKSGEDKGQKVEGLDKRVRHEDQEPKGKPRSKDRNGPTGKGPREE